MTKNFTKKGGDDKFPAAYGQILSCVSQLLIQMLNCICLPYGLTGQLLVNS